MADTVLRDLRIRWQTIRAQALALDEVVTKALAADGFVHPDIEIQHAGLMAADRMAYDAYQREARNPRNFISVTTTL